MKIQVGFIISVQISIIVASFLILVYFENQSVYLGNTINISGKNRFLAELLYTRTSSYSLDLQNQPFDVMSNIENNLYVLSQGGTSTSDMSSSTDSIIVMAVPSVFLDDLNKVKNKWSLYKTAVTNIIYEKKDLNNKIMTDLYEKESQFVLAANNLTEKLGMYSKEQIANLMVLQLLLLGINVGAHIFLLRMILKIIKQDYAKKLLLQQIFDDGKQLSFQTRMAELKKDILEIFIDDMNDNLGKLYQQITVMTNPNEHEKNKFVFNELTHKLSTVIDQLAEAKNEFNDKKSYYEQLNQKLAKSLSVHSKYSKNDDKIKNTDDVITIIQSYADGLSFLISNQTIPPRLGKNLTDTMYEIIDYLEKIKNDK